MEFRTEFFNAFNNVNFANPITLPASVPPVLSQDTIFGHIVATTTGPRVIQFALKFNF
jgi:hypothetical protein